MKSNKEKILTAASKLLPERGPGKLSVRAIAAEAKLSTIGIYSHFNGKQGILDALYVEGFNKVRNAAESAMAIPDAREALLQGARSYLDMAQDNDAEYRLIFGESDADYKPGDAARSAGANAFRALVRLVSKALPDDAVRVRRKFLALRFWAILHGYVSIQHHALNDVDKLSDWIEEILASMAMMIDAEMVRQAKACA